MVASKGLSNKLLFLVNKLLSQKHKKRKSNMITKKKKTKKPI